MLIVTYVSGGWGNRKCFEISRQIEQLKSNRIGRGKTVRGFMQIL